MTDPDGNVLEVTWSNNREYVLIKDDKQKTFSPLTYSFKHLTQAHTMI